VITTSFLHDVALYTEGRVEKVILNGTHEITNFEVKHVTESTLALNYIVTATEVPVITLIELKDASNQVLSSNIVNVPITADTMMLQPIEVKEASRWQKQIGKWATLCCPRI